MAASSTPRPVVALPRPETLAVLEAELLFAGGLAAILPAQVQPGFAPSGGDHCASTRCPPGTHCTFTSSCTPRCEVDPLPMRAP
jgi:hypothetical protein